MASNFFNKASLVMIPEAPLDSKVLSIKPEDRTGDFTFSRGSNLAATRVGPTGLIEKGRENLLTYSNDFSNAAWTKFGSPTLTSGQSGYDGSSDAWLYESTTASHSMLQFVSGSGVYSFSVYAKAGTADGIRLRFSASIDTNIYVDLTDGSIITDQSGITYNIESVASGWYRISITSNVSSLSNVRLIVVNNAGAETTGTIYIQDAQLEIGLAATDYIESGASTGKAGLLEDEPRFDYSGGATCPSLLLEPSRTQLVEYSEAFSQWNSNLGSPVVTDNFATSPEGLTNATKITFPTSNDGVTDVFGIGTTGNNLVFSIYVKNIDASFTEIRIRNSTTDFESRVNWTGSQITSVTTIDGTLEYEAVGNDWYRIWGAYTNDDANQRPRLYSNGANSSYLVYGAQLEVGSYPTSYIPNHSGGTITRGADACIKTSYPDLSSQQELTLYAEFNYEQSGRVIAIGNGTTNTRFFASYGSDKQIYMYLNIGGTLAFFLTSSNNVVSDGKNKVAVKIKSGESLLYLNGTEVFNNTSTFTLSGFQNVYIGTSEYGSTNDTQKIDSSLIFYNALSAADLTTLTTL